MSTGKSIGIIGFGQFGRLAAEQLSTRFPVGVHDPQAKAGVIDGAGFASLTLEEAAGRDIVIIAVPIQAMEGVIRDMAPMIRTGATVIEVASVKMMPGEWLAKYLPESVHIVSAHPLFGPQSVARDGLAGRQLVLCPIRGEQHLKVAAMGEAMGLRVRIVSAEEHDREMAYVQALTHLIGRTLSAMAIPDESLKTQTYQHLLDMCSLIGNDTFELFTAMQVMNPFAAEVVDEFITRAEDLLATARG
jgi:prephenate dehydrogenase